MKAEFQHQGAGTRLQKQMMTDWYKRQEDAEQTGLPIAYMFIGGSPNELLRNFGYELSFPEINALQCGIKKAAGPNIIRAEDFGYSSDVCGYVKNDIGLMLNNYEAPLGKMAKPSFLVCNASGCATYLKWWEALAQHYDVPLFVLDVPYVQGDEVPKEEVDYVEAQIHQLVELLEKTTGQSLDLGRLKDDLANAREAEDRWSKVLDMAMNKPSPFDSYFEAVFFMANINIFRGTPEAVGYYDAVLKELQERVDHGIGPIPEEKVRVVVEGPPPWPHFRSFWELFKPWGVVSVASTYSKVGGLWDQGFRHDPAKPFRSMAEAMLHAYCNWSMPKRLDLIQHYIDKFEADALVIHSVKSCRSFSVGQADLREHFHHNAKVPTLFVESDLADPRYFSHAQLRNRIDAFFESLEHRKLIEAGGTGTKGAGATAAGGDA